jgi:hypothetical protein
VFYYAPQTRPTCVLLRATDATWQDQLRTCIHLYLSPNTDATLEQELDDLFKRNEQELLDYLRAGELLIAVAQQ